MIPRENYLYQKLKEAPEHYKPTDSTTELK